MKKLCLITFAIFFCGCSTGQQSLEEIKSEQKIKPKVQPIKMIADDPSLTKEEAEMIRTLELLILIRELEASKTYRLETNKEYQERIKKGVNNANRTL